MLGTEFDDVARQYGPDPRQGVELLLGRRTEAHRPARTGSATRRPTARTTAPGTTGAGAAPGRGTRHADRDLFAVGQQPRPIQPADISPVQHTARGPQSVDHSRARRHPVNAGMPDLTRDIDDQLAPTAARGAAR